LFELFGELLQVVRGRRILVRVVVVTLRPVLVLMLGRWVAVFAEVRAVVVLMTVSKVVVVHPLPAAWDQPVDAETRLGVNKALAVSRRHGRYVRRRGGSPRPTVVVAPVRLVHQVGRP